MLTYAKSTRESLCDVTTVHDTPCCSDDSAQSAALLAVTPFQSHYRRPYVAYSQHFECKRSSDAANQGRAGGPGPVPPPQRH